MQSKPTSSNQSLGQGQDSRTGHFSRQEDDGGHQAEATRPGGAKEVFFLAEHLQKNVWH